MGSSAPAPQAQSFAASSAITEYARRYGLAKDPIFAPGRSGISPIDDEYENVTGWQSIVDLVDNIRYQEDHLMGFRTQSIEFYHQLTDDGVSLKSNLHAIHPMIDRDRWQTGLVNHLAFHPVMVPGKSGLWTASNDEVWEILVPILALASKFIDHFHLWHWWDTLTYGKREVINTDNMPDFPADRPPLMRVVPRTAEIAALCRGACEKAREDAAKRVVLGLSSAHCLPSQGLPFMRSNGIRHAHAGASIRTWPGAPGQIVLHLCYEDLVPLMSSELSEEERLMSQLIVAITLIHELGHSLGYTLFTDSGPREPYVADEPLIELGHSLINTILGGENVTAIIAHRRRWLHLREIHPMAVILRTGWPTYTNVWTHASSDRPCLDPNILKKNRELRSFLIPVNWIAKIQQEDYWDQQVSVYGPAAMRPEPLTIGILEILKTVNPLSVSRGLTEKSDWAGPYGPHDGPFTEEEKLARQERIAQAEDIALNMRGALEETYERMEMLTKTSKGKVIYTSSSKKFSKPEESFKITPGQGRKPKTFGKIVTLLIENRAKLALDTMRNWTPAHLLLSYIHRLGQWQVPAIEFFEFLISCQAHSAYFYYDHKGAGMVRMRPGSPWPFFLRKKVPVAPPPNFDLFIYGTSLLKREILFLIGDPQDVFLCDVDVDQLYFVVRRRMKFDRAYFNQAMAYSDYTDGYFTFGPEGILRLNTSIPEPERPPIIDEVNKPPPAGPPPAQPSGPSTAPPPQSTTESTPDPMEGISEDSDTDMASPHYQHYTMERDLKRKMHHHSDSGSGSGEGWNSGDGEGEVEFPAFIREFEFRVAGEGEGELRGKRQRRR